MAPNDIGLPPDGGDGGGSEAEEAAWEMATAEALRAQGQLADAADWYRRAANHLMEAGDDERAISIAKLAAELAALDDAGRPSGRISAADPSPDKTVQIKPVLAAAAAPVARPPVPPAPPPISSGRGGRAKGPSLMPWEKKASRLPTRAKTSVAATAKQTPLPSSAEVPPWEREPSRRPSTSSKARTGPRAPAVAKQAPPPPPPPAAVAPPGVPIESDDFAIEEATTVVGSPLEAVPEDGQTGRMPALSASPLAALVDEAVSGLDEAPSAPLSTTPGDSHRAGPQRPSLIYSPARAAAAERIAQRLPVMPLFAELPPERLEAIARQVGVARLEIGEALCEAGGPEGPMFLLLEGSAYVGLAGSKDVGTVVAAGDTVGEIAALFGGPRTATVVAQEPVEALAFAPSLVRALAREFDAFRDSLVEAACERMRASLPMLAPMLRRVADAQRAALFAQFELRAVAEGTLLLTEGEPVDGLYIVAGGEAELYGGEFGVRRTHHARVGEALGVTGLVTGEAAGVSARASRMMLIAHLDRERFASATQTHLEWADALADVSTPGRGVLC